MLALLLLLLFQAEGATVDGVVFKPGGSEPLGGARVMLNSIADFQKQFSAITEDDGRFTLNNIPPGDYTMTANHSRYGTTALGQRRPGGPRTTFSLTAGQKLTDIKISMTPTGSIAGRITGGSGQPLVGVSVQAYQYSYRDGKRTLQMVQATITNDLGEYRLFWLPPGQYFVAAANGETARVVALGAHAPGVISVTTNNGPMILPDIPSPGVFLDSSFGAAVIRRVLDDGSTVEESWVPMYYPGTTEVHNATGVNVAAGATLNGVNISIAPSPVRKISGQVVGAQLTGANVSLDSPDTPGAFLTTIASPSFEFKGVRPGSYILYATDARSGFMSDELTLTVGDRNVEGLVLTVRPGISVTGRVTIENSNDNKALADITIVLHQGDIELPMSTLSLQSAAGTFQAMNVRPGNYQARVGSVRTPGVALPFVKSVRMGGVDVTNNIPIREGLQAPLEITLSNEYGSVEGKVSDPGRPAASGATVVLVPAVARGEGSLYKATVADAAGKFKFPTVNSGDYLAFAWDDVETGAWQNTEFMRNFESKGRPVHVSGNAKSDVQVTVIATP